MIDLTYFGFTRLGVTDYEFGRADFDAKRRTNYYHLTTVFGNYHMVLENGTSSGGRFGEGAYVLNRFGSPKTTEKELLDELVRCKMEDIASIYRKYKIDQLLA